MESQHCLIIVMLGGNSFYCYYDYYLFYPIAYLIILELATMNPLGWHPPYLVDNTDTLYLVDQHWQQKCRFFRFLLFCVHLLVYMLVSVSARLYAIHLKFLGTHYCKASIDLRMKNDKNAVMSIRWVRLSLS